MTMHKALHDQRTNTAIVKKGGRGLTNLKDRVDTSIRRLEDYIQREKKTDYCTQDQQNNKNKKTKMGRKTTVWTVQVIN